ncbi:Nuclear pore complex nucleoporin component [Mactra antiquata]
MGIIDNLRNTNKGRLSYERDFDGTKVKSLLKECSSPPALHISPKFSQNLSLEEKDDNTRKDEEISSYCKSEENKSKQNSPVILTQLTSSVRSIEDTRIVNMKQKVALSEFGSSRLAVKKYEESLLEQARKAAKVQKQREFEEAENRFEREAELKVQELEQKANFDVLKRIQSIELQNESQAAEIVKQHRLLKETHDQRKQIHDARIQEAEQARRKLRQEEIRRKEQEYKERLEKITKCAAQLSRLNTKIHEDVHSCKYQNYISEPGKKSLTLIEKYVTNMDTLVKMCQGGEITVEMCEQCKTILESASEAYELIRKELERAVNEGKEAEKEKQLKLQQEQAAVEANKQNQPGGSAGTPLATSTPVVTNNRQTNLTDLAGATGGQSLCVDIQAFRRYTELQEKLKRVEQSTAVLSSTPQLKKYKFDLQKAVNTPINAISTVSGDHLRDKLKRLLLLLSGQQVEVTGRTVSIKQHPQGGDFSKYLIAKMMVKKGDEQVSSKHESAFALGMVAAGLWREVPDIGDLLLAHFHSQCPYLVPYYIPRQEGQSDEDYFRSRGYKYEGEVVEKHDKFLKRMSGIMRLYFSIMVSSPPRGEHPHGIQYAWTWITRVLNLEPETDITAAMIYDFLQVTGNMLCHTYKKQFLKLLHILVKELLPKLKSVSSEAGSGTLTRLQMLLENSVKHHGEIPVPDGFLKSNFWLS